MCRCKRNKRILFDIYHNLLNIHNNLDFYNIYHIESEHDKKIWGEWNMRIITLHEYTNKTTILCCDEKKHVINYANCVIEKYTDSKTVDSLRCIKNMMNDIMRIVLDMF